MEYRINQKTKDKISILGLGASVLSDNGHDEGIRILETAYDNGINYFDLAGGSSELFDLHREVFSNGRRKDIFYQLHFGAIYNRGKYGWSLNPKMIEQSIETELKQLKTDYIDFGFIHCIDQAQIWQMHQKKGILDMIRRYQEQGIIRHLGLSSHTPVIAEQIMDEVDLGMLMFSINPAYDYHHGDFANGTAVERMHLYQRCEKEGVGISVMKPYAGGQLLDDKQSIFGQALTEVQCLKYALDKPGVLTVVPGISSEEHLHKVLHLLDATSEELDYSIISTATPKDVAGRCVYCNHCAPCPQGINVGLVNKYYDLARVGDEMAAMHYKNLEKHASDCIRCNHCNQSCPFRVDQMSVMEEIKTYMGF
ncbi:MAG: aldo/keto reductase [Eubacterium sp.]|nr:aldo/keto reductase [Eubacterium sp.]